MRILFLSQYFPPEICAPAARVSEMCRFWAREGDQVTVVTAFPNHPNGVIPPEYQGKTFMREEVEGYEILRSWIYVAPNKGFAKRLLCFFSFLLSSIYTATFKAGDCDVVAATSPQLFAGLAGWVVSVIKKRPFVIEIRDLWPDSAIQLGILKNPLLIRLAQALESFLYRRADLIVPVSDSIRDAILEHGIPEERILLLPNGIDPDLFVPGPRNNEMRAELGLKDEFIVSYIGTHGMAHGLERVVEAANRLRDHPEIFFLFIGEGAKKPDIIKRAEELKVERIKFLSSRPKHEMPQWYAASDLPMVALLDLPVFSTVLPSKMFEIMACERPVLMVARGECAALLESAEAGKVVEPGSLDALVNAILELAKDRDKCLAYGKSGRAFVLEHFDRRTLAHRYLDRLRTLASDRRRLERRSA